MGQTQKSPIGVIPKYIHSQQVEKYISDVGGVCMDSIYRSRLIDLGAATMRYLEAGMKVNIEWIKEYNILVNYFNQKQ